jgi:hypothetical protein
MVSSLALKGKPLAQNEISLAQMGSSGAVCTAIGAVFWFCGAQIQLKACFLLLILYL